MAWNHFFLAKPTNVTATLQDGGSLDPNTTYYVKIVAEATAGDTRSTSWIVLQSHYTSEWSDTISFTTTDTQRQVYLTWDPVYKHNGVEVDGYAVLVSKTGTFAHHTTIFRTSNYVYPSTLTNSFTLSANPNYVYRDTHLGFPYIWWSGSGTATPDNLYEYMRNNIPNYENWIQVLKVPVVTDPQYAFAYNTLACIKINRSTDDVTYDDGKYTLNIFDRIWINWGSFELVGGKVKVVNSVLCCVGTTHSAGNNYLAKAADGSVIWGSIIHGNYGTVGTHFSTSAGRPWGISSQAGGKIIANDHDTFFGIIIGWPNNATLACTSTNPRDLICISNSTTSGGIRTTNYLKNILPAMGTGTDNLMSINDYYWDACAWTTGIYLQNYYYVYMQGPFFYLVNCYFKDKTYGYTLYPRIQLSSYYNSGSYAKHKKSFLAKTIKVKVLDKNANPVSGAKVYFLGPNNENLAISNSTSDIVSFIVPQAVSGYNYDPNEQNPPMDTPYLWLKYYTNNAGTIISQLEAGQEYFVYGQRIKVIRRITDATPPAGTSNWHLYEVERNVTGIRSGWICGTSGDDNYSHLLRAKPYHTTDSNGECWNVTMWADYRLENYVTNTKYIKEFVSDGTYSEVLYLPIKVRIEAPSYQTVDVYLTESLLALYKNMPVNLVVQLPNQVKFLMPMGKRIYKNLKPEDGQNKVLWEEV